MTVMLAACGDEGGPDPETPPAPAPTAIGGVTQIASPNEAWLSSTRAVVALPKATIDAANVSRGWAALSGPARCDVTVHEIRHPTVGPRGEATDASGAVYVPGGDGCTGPWTLLAYSRGSDLDRARSMTTADDREVQAAIGFFAARGFVVVASDYLGYAGSSFPYHPYLHAESEARTTIDALRAARVLLTRLGAAESGRLVLTGYSQGGHAALATARAIGRDAPAGVPAPAAIAPMSGPYDLAGTFIQAAQLLPLTLVDLGSSSAQTVALRIGDVLGTGAQDLIDGQGGLRDLLQQNSVIGWTPVAPVLLCGGARDPVVPFSNTTRASADFAARGASVTVVDVDTEPAYASLLPPPDATRAALSDYHQGAAPAPCFAIVRDRLLERYR